MNWYKFKIELSSFAAKLFLCVVTALVVLRTLIIKGDYYYPVEMRTAVEHDWLIKSVLLLATAALWALYWKIFHMYRSRKAYGER